MTRTAALLLATALAGLPGWAQSRGAREKELLLDPHLEWGFHILSPQPGKRVVQETVRFRGAKGEPVWDIGQWSSKFTLADSRPTRLKSGVAKLADKSKFVIVSRRDKDYADIVLGIDSRPEYGDRMRKADEPWPHLLIQQDLKDSPAFGELKEVRLTIESRLKEVEVFKNEGYTTDLHCAQCPLVLIIQDRNPDSPGHGDFYWFQVPLYDDRYEFPPEYAAMDTADPSAKLIFNPGFKAYSDKSLNGGKWVKIDCDVLPFILQGLKIGWEKGYLKNSRNAADFRISSFILGWEVTGTHRAEIQFRNISLKAVLKP